MKILVCGGRDYADKEKVYATLDKWRKVELITHVIHGDATGADKLADQWAIENGIQPVRCPALWDFYKRAAGPLRNESMAELNPHMMLAFPGGKGTKNMVETAERYRIRVEKIK